MRLLLEFIFSDREDICAIYMLFIPHHSYVFWSCHRGDNKQKRHENGMHGLM